MNTRGVMLLTLLVALAVVSWYLGRDITEVDLDDSNAPRVTSGYYLLDAEIVGTDESGTERYRINAGQATQSAIGEPIQLEDVRVLYGESDAAHWLINANGAVLKDDNKNLQLTGDVRAVWSDAKSAKPMRMTTETLAFDATLRIVETDDKVKFDVGLGELVATGMRASLDNNTIELRSNIRGQFTP
ncbi:MAG: LPS export ABC transporter periplasmic protein LptC [Woeseiaceae bacterium]